MATAKTTAIETSSRPLIQIDDLVREMTEEEYDNYVIECESIPTLEDSAL